MKPSIDVASPTTMNRSGPKDLLSIDLIAVIRTEKNISLKIVWNYRVGFVSVSPPV